MKDKAIQIFVEIIARIIVVLFFSSLALVFIDIILGFGDKRITDFLPEKKPEKIYVYAFPDDTKAKNYRLKAKLLPNYNLTVYFENGGYLFFEDCENFNKKGKYFYCYNEKNNETWHFKYYGEKIN